MAKKIAKPSTDRKGYFYEEEELAVIEYLNCKNQQKREYIYLNKIHFAFTKMIESIIRRYKLFIPDEVYEDTFADTLSFLITKLDKFEPGKYKAYSYYGTICKNYLIGRIQAFAKLQERNRLYCDVSGGFNSLKYSNENIDKDSIIANETIFYLTAKIKDMVEKKDEIPLKENEVKVGESLINLFENWDYIMTTNGSHKLNKSAVLLYLKDTTGLDAKGIRDNMKKFKKEFQIIKDYLVR